MAEGFSSDARATANRPDRLVEATLQLRRDEVATDLTVRRVATAAGTTTMALYTGFGSRDGLLDVVYAQGFEQLYEQMAPSAQLTDPAEALVALLDAYRAFALANPGLYGLLFERALPAFDPSPEVRTTALNTTFGLLATQTGRLLATEPLSPPSRQLAHTLWALTHGLVTLELSHASRSPLAHAALAETDERDVLATALRVHPRRLEPTHLRADAAGTAQPEAAARRSRGTRGVTDDPGAL